jgi:hypothetical protein
VSFQTRAGVSARILFAIVAAGVPCGTLAQPTFEPVAKSPEQRQLVEQIVETQSRDGPFSPQLVELLAKLGDSYQENGDADLAAAATDRARQVVRVNEGLFSLEQLPLLRQSIEHAETIGDITAAQQLEQDLRALIQRHPTDLRTVPVLHELGDKQMDYLRRRLAGELPAPFNISVSMRQGSDPFQGRAASLMGPLWQAWSYYGRAINVLLHHQQYASAELDDLETQFVRISFQNGAYQSGRESLLRQVSYDVAKGEPWAARLNKLIGVADWDLLFVHNSRAHSTYAQAFALLKQKGASARTVEEIFSPKVPIVLPTFLPNPLATSEAGSTGYIDVAFDVHKYGGSRQAEIVGATANATDEEKTRLLRTVMRSQFRPRSTDGEFWRTSPVVLRYFLHTP